MLKSKYKIFALLLIMTFSFNVFMVEVFALENTSLSEKSNLNITKNALINIENVPNEIKYQLKASNNSAKSISNDNDLYSFTTINEDGSKTLYKFEAPIKYKEDNKVKFINNDLKESNKWYGFFNKYAYENSENNIKTYLPNNIKDGVLIESENFSMIFSPIIKNNSEGILVASNIDGLSKNVFQYNNVYDSNIRLQYTPISTGIKENIIIDKYAGINTFQFKVNAKGLEPAYNSGESIPMLDSKTKEIVFIFGQVDAKDSYIGDNTSNDTHTSLYNNLKIESTGITNEYLLTVEVDKTFLESDKTVYPVIVDPPAYVYQGNMLDTTVYSGMPTTQSFYSSSYNIVGNHGGSYGQANAYIQINNMQDYKYINPSNITSAYYHVREASGKTNTSVIELQDTYSTWQQNTITYNNQPSTYNYNGIAVTVTTSQWYDFNITGLLQAWLKSELYEGGWMKEYGFALKARDTTASSKHFCSANYSGSLAPSIIINYNEDTSIKNEIYFIKSVNSGLYLDSDFNTSNGNVIQRNYNGATSQQWKIIDQGNGYYKIYSPYYNNTKCLDVEDLTANNIDVYPDGSGDWLLFRIVSNNDGSYRIMNKWNGNIDKSLDVAGGSRTSGANVIQYQYYGNDNQKWVFEPTVSGLFSKIISSTPANQIRVDSLRQATIDEYNKWPALSISEYYGWDDFSRTIEISGIQTFAYTQATAAYWTIFPNGGDMMYHYLGNTGSTYNVNFKMINNQWNFAIQQRKIHINEMLSAAEKLAVLGKILTIYSKEESQNIVNEISDFGISIGKFYSHITCSVAKNSSNSYSATVNYYLKDNYDWNRTDWNKVGLVSPHEMWELNHVGKAKSYAVQGVNTLTINWTTGQRYNTGANVVDIS